MAVIEANISKLTQERPPFKGHVVRSIWVEISRVGPEPLDSHSSCLNWNRCCLQVGCNGPPIPKPFKTGSRADEFQLLPDLLGQDNRPTTSPRSCLVTASDATSTGHAFFACRIPFTQFGKFEAKLFGATPPVPLDICMQLDLQPSSDAC